jgi:hypothetical protein
MCKGQSVVPGGAEPFGFPEICVAVRLRIPLFEPKKMRNIIA